LCDGAHTRVCDAARASPRAAIRDITRDDGARSARRASSARRRARDAVIDACRARSRAPDVARRANRRARAKNATLLTTRERREWRAFARARVRSRDRGVDERASTRVRAIARSRRADRRASAPVRASIRRGPRLRVLKRENIAAKSKKQKKGGGRVNESAFSSRRNPALVRGRTFSRLQEASTQRARVRDSGCGSGSGSGTSSCVSFAHLERRCVTEKRGTIAPRARNRPRARRKRASGARVSSACHEKRRAFSPPRPRRTRAATNARAHERLRPRRRRDTFARGSREAATTTTRLTRVSTLERRVISKHILESFRIRRNGEA
jgi:hypothetical protein